MFPCILYFFIHPQPNNIGLARQQPRDWGSLLISLESGWGREAQLLLISFATTRLHGICNGSIDGMEDGGHTLQPHSLGTGYKCTPPPQKKNNKKKTTNFRVFCLGLGGAQKYFILRDQTTGDLKSNHLQALVTLTALSVPHGHIFFHISNLSQLCISVYTHNIIQCVKKVVFRALMAFMGEGGTCPHSPPPWVRN